MPAARGTTSRRTAFHSARTCSAPMTARFALLADQFSGGAEMGGQTHEVALKSPNQWGAF
ncbi:MAG: hypothetical protein IPI28_13255 [Candidatus Omnitrophica bacterium]|nr:hypothetical protein [Candidatus Omnitrophota bacterium]